jgi:hypothetical protein
MAPCGPGAAKPAAIDNIDSAHDMAAGGENLENRAVAATGITNGARQFFDLHERLHGAGRRRIEVVVAILGAMRRIDPQLARLWSLTWSLNEPGFHPPEIGRPRYTESGCRLGRVTLPARPHAFFSGGHAFTARTSNATHAADNTKTNHAALTRWRSVIGSRPYG